MYLTWEQLDACKTSSDIAALLLKNHILGIPGSIVLCPLARATNCKVKATCRYSNDNKSSTALTSAEFTFVHEFDTGQWRELETQA